MTEHDEPVARDSGDAPRHPEPDWHRSKLRDYHPDEDQPDESGEDDSGDG